MNEATISFKRKKGRPKVGATLVGVSFPPDLLAALDSWIAHQEDRAIKRPEAVRRILREVFDAKERSGSS
ncbi:MAG: hypothetical protein ACRCTG_14570 [Aestuariivirga sp.]